MTPLWFSSKKYGGIQVPVSSSPWTSQTSSRIIESGSSHDAISWLCKHMTDDQDAIDILKHFGKGHKTRSFIWRIDIMAVCFEIMGTDKVHEILGNSAVLKTFGISHAEYLAELKLNRKLREFLT